MVKGIKGTTGTFIPGKKLDLPTWIEKFEWACMTYGMDNAQKAAEFGTLLEGTAFRVYRDIHSITKRLGNRQGGTSAGVP